MPSGVKDGYRTSQTAWLSFGMDPTLASIQNRTAHLLGLPLSDFIPLAEDLQVVHYGEGEQFGVHHDSSAGFQRRDLTLLIYLNDVEAGGQTVFPEASEAGAGGLSVSPRKGTAVLFYNLLEGTTSPDPLAVHQALPVATGEKYACNFWVGRPNGV